MHVEELLTFFVLFPEPSESFTAVLKAYQNLEPGDFTGFLKLLKGPASHRLQSRCTNFLDRMEACHVIICAFSFYKFTTPIILYFTFMYQSYQITEITFTGSACTETV